MSAANGSSARVAGDVILVGSLPFDSTDAAFRGLAEGLGSLVSCLPDGEQGPRKFWVNYLPQHVFANHPDLVELHRYEADGPEEQPEHDQTARPGAARSHQWTFAFKDGVDDITLDLGYSGFALESWQVFDRLREAGVVERGTRFQICLPATMSAVDAFFERDHDRERVQIAYRDAIRRNVNEILDVVPAEDVAFQLDLAMEVCDIAIGDETYFPFWPTRTRSEKIDNRLGLLAELTEVFPDKVPLGYHWCYGTWGGWPMVAMSDLRLCVELSNRSVAKASRPIDYIHMPVDVTSDEAFYRPLGDLAVGDTRIYLGMIHFHEEDQSAFAARVATAKRFLPSFGIGAVCGYGRSDPAEIGDIFATHRACAEFLRAPAR